MRLAGKKRERERQSAKEREREMFFSFFVEKRPPLSSHFSRSFFLPLLRRPCDGEQARLEGHPCAPRLFFALRAHSFEDLQGRSERAAKLAHRLKEPALCRERQISVVIVIAAAAAAARGQQCQSKQLIFFFFPERPPLVFRRRLVSPVILLSA